jgi:excisionase family DNA binding protein
VIVSQKDEQLEAAAAIVEKAHKSGDHAAIVMLRFGTQNFTNGAGQVDELVKLQMAGIHHVHDRLPEDLRAAYLASMITFCKNLADGFLMMKITPAQAAKELGCSRRRIYALIESGRLKAEPFGRSWSIEFDDLEPVRDRKPGNPQKIRKKVVKST